MHIESLNFSMDINGDGVYSRWEVWETVVWAYRLPGNLVMEGLGHVPVLSDLLGIKASAATGYASLNGTVAVTLSLVFWLAIVVGLLSASSRATAAGATKKPDIRLLPWHPDHDARHPHRRPVVH